MPLHITNLPSLVIREILSLLPATDQVKVLMVWPEWCPLATRRQLSISHDAVGCDSVDETFASTHNVLQLFPSLTHLDLSGMTPMRKASILSQVGSCGGKLKVLKLGFCCRAEVWLCDMLRNLGELEEFHTSFDTVRSRSVTAVLQALLTTATGLHTLDLSESYNVTSAAFQDLRQRLRVLNLSRVLPIPPATLLSLLAPSKESLHVLNMADGFPMLHGSVADAVSAFPHLTYLHLPPAPELVMHALCEHPSAEATDFAKLARLRHLQDLHIPDHYCIHEADVHAIHNGCPRLTRFRRPPNCDHNHSSMLSSNFYNELPFVLHYLTLDN